MNKSIFLLGIIIILIAGCSTGIVRSKVEKGAKESLAERIGNAKSYEVTVKGSDASIASGKIKSLHIEGFDVEMQDILVDKMIIDMEDVRFNPRTRAIKSVAETKFSADVSDAAVNSYVSKHKTYGSFIKISFKDNSISADVNPSFAGIEMEMSITGKPIIKDGTKINFEADTGSLSILPIPSSLVKGMIDRYNPVFDTASFNLPVTLDEIVVNDGYITLIGNANVD